MLGAIIFTIASAANPLARRLQESEALAHQRGIDLANMAQLNDYIIQHLRESIVVVDEHENIRLINQSAAEHLGAGTRDPGRPLHSVSQKLHQILLNWRRHGGSTREAASFLSADGMTQVNTYVAPLEQRQDGPVLIFLEDAGLLAEKVQQTKLAALGRLSASIAHEIRNPVGALSHAGQLLQEAPGIGDYEQRLLNIISTNSKRTSEIVDSVLQLSRREPTHPELISLADWTAEFIDEFTSTLELDENRIDLGRGSGSASQNGSRAFAPDLLESLRKRSEIRQRQPRRYNRQSELRAPPRESQTVSGNFADRGPGISGEMRDQLFEPFATGRVGETGLGLFISRELCECNHAALIYEARTGGGSTFRVVFADPTAGGRQHETTSGIALVDDEPDLCELLSITLERMQIEADTCGDVSCAREMLQRRDYQLCLTDMRLPDGDGLELVEWIQTQGLTIPVAVITAHGNVETAVRALKLGAFDFISKPLDLQSLRKLVGSALKLSRTDEIAGKAQMIGDSTAVSELRGMIDKVARSQAPVHITGESGTGKELVARMIHEQGAQAEGPFVPVNCGAIPSELMESEFFGHVKGAFTGPSATTRAFSISRRRHVIHG